MAMPPFSTPSLRQDAYRRPLHLLFFGFVELPAVFPCIILPSDPEGPFARRATKAPSLAATRASTPTDFVTTGSTSFIEASPAPCSNCLPSISSEDEESALFESSFWALLHSEPHWLRLTETPRFKGCRPRDARDRLDPLEARELDLDACLFSCTRAMASLTWS